LVQLVGGKAELRCYFSSEKKRKTLEPSEFHPWLVASLDWNPEEQWQISTASFTIMAST
jgi:hypothetical protein